MSTWILYKSLAYTGLVYGAEAYLARTYLAQMYAPNVDFLNLPKAFGFVVLAVFFVGFFLLQMGMQVRPSG